jgi:hypothetical protein
MSRSRMQRYLVAKDLGEQVGRTVDDLAQLHFTIPSILIKLLTRFKLPIFALMVPRLLMMATREA